MKDKLYLIAGIQSEDYPDSALFLELTDERARWFLEKLDAAKRFVDMDPDLDSITILGDTQKAFLGRLSDAGVEEHGELLEEVDAAGEMVLYATGLRPHEAWWFGDQSAWVNPRRQAFGWNVEDGYGRPVASTQRLQRKHLLRARCWLAPDDELRDIFAELAQLDPWSAVGMLEDGVMVLGSSPRPIRHLMDKASLVPLFQASDADIRQRAVLTLGRTR